MNTSDDIPRPFGSWSASPRFIFRVLLAAIATSTSVGLWYAIANRDAFQASFSGAADPRVYAGLLMVGVLGLVAVVGLWRWQRWALVLYGLVVLASLGLDILARAPGVHQLTVVVAAAIMFLLVYLNRTRFRRP